MKFKKLLASACTALLIGLGLSVVAMSPASAHDGVLTGTAQCEADGTYTVTWTYNQTNTPDGMETDVKVVASSPSGSSFNLAHGIWLNAWAEHAGNYPGVATQTGNYTTQFKQVGIIGTATTATVRVQIDYHNGPNSGYAEGSVSLDGKCTPPLTSVTPPAPVWVDECGPNNGYWSYTDTDQYSYNALPTGEITVSPKPGYVFPEGTTTWLQETDSNELCPLGPANPVAVIDADCGTATVALTNPGENILTASYVVNVDGKFYQAYAVEQGKQEVVNLTFGEDTGIHKVEVFQAETSAWKSIAKADVKSDCIPPQPKDKVVVTETTPEVDCENEVGEELPTTITTVTTPYVWDGEAYVLDTANAETVETEGTYVVTEDDIADLDCPVVVPPTEEPPVTVPPTDTTVPTVPAQVVSAAVAPVLAATGVSAAPIFWLTGGAFAVAIGALGIVLGLRRRQVHNEG